MPANMSSRLNPAAQPFCPTQAIPIPRSNVPALPEDPFELSNASEVALSPAELEELETVESWVNLMADLEEGEAEHCIAMALRYGDKHKIQEIKQRSTHKGAKHKKGVQKPKLSTVRAS